MVYGSLLPLAPLSFWRGGRPGQAIAELAVEETEGLGVMPLPLYPSQPWRLLYPPWFSSKGALSSLLNTPPSYSSLPCPPLLQGLRCSNLVKEGLAYPPVISIFNVS